MVKLTQNWGMDDLGPCVFRLCSWARGAKESVTGFLTTENESQGIHGTAGIFTYRKTIKKKNQQNVGKIYHTWIL